MSFAPLEHTVILFLNNEFVFIEISRVGVFGQATGNMLVWHAINPISIPVQGDTVTQMITIMAVRCHWVLLPWNVKEPWKHVIYNIYISNMSYLRLYFKVMEATQLK